MINNDVVLFSATNEETPHEQLLHLLTVNSFNIENQTIKKKKASTKNLETKVVGPLLKLKHSDQKITGS